MIILIYSYIKGGKRNNLTYDRYNHCRINAATRNWAYTRKANGDGGSRVRVNNTLHKLDIVYVDIHTHLRAESQEKDRDNDDDEEYIPSLPNNSNSGNL